MSVLLSFLPVPETMALHAVTQIASNGWRALLWRRHVRWRSAVTFLMGGVCIFCLWTFWLYVPSKPVAFLLLGASPFVARAIPSALRPNPANAANGMAYGGGCMALLLLTGVSGPLVDTYFLGGALDRREIVATKATCQIVGHVLKLAYFGGFIGAAASLDPKMAGLAVAASMLGTTLARPILERLTDTNYRVWANRLITAISVVFLIQAGLGFLAPVAWRGSHGQ
jgi:hypothetical protein